MNQQGYAKTYYCYRHIRKDKDQPFYVGIGTLKEDAKSLKRTYFRAFTFSEDQRSVFWRKVYLKCNKQIDVEILFETENYKEIQAKEMEFIQLYGRVNTGTGTLVNLTDGGEGMTNFKHSPEALLKIIESNKRRKKPVVKVEKQPKIRTAEERLQISLRLKGKPKSEEHKKKLSDYMKGRNVSSLNVNAKPVIQLSKEGDFIKEFPTTADAERELSVSNIWAALNGVQKHCGGFKWKYKDGQ